MRKINVAFLCNDNYPWQRHFIDETLQIANVKFNLVNDLDQVRSADFVTVFGDLPRRLSLPLEKSKLVFIAPEPISVIKYPVNFLSQFGTVITTDRDTPHPNRIFTNPGLPWHAGVFGANNNFRKDPLTAAQFLDYFPKKERLVSVICSDKVFTEQHKLRFDFVERLKKHFGNKIDYYGRGSNEFIDKESVIAPYRYHIALENSEYKDYWTEKISDPILLLSYPIFHGCNNLETYLPSDSFTRIDIKNPEQAIKIIEETINSDLDISQRQSLIAARKKIIFEQSTFPIIARTLNALSDSSDFTKNSGIIKTVETLSFINSKNAQAKNSLINRIVNPKSYMRKLKYYFNFLQNKI